MNHYIPYFTLTTIAYTILHSCLKQEKYVYITPKKKKNMQINYFEFRRSKTLCVIFDEFHSCNKMALNRNTAKRNNVKRGLIVI